jgi:uroporphyrinogen-III decarboxylase
MLPELSSALFGYRAVTETLTIPEVTSAIETFLKAGYELSKWNSRIGASGLAAFGLEIQKLGFPLFTQAHAPVPFDMISDHLRGMRGTMLDMYRQPDKLIEACEKVLPIILNKAISAAKRSGNPRIFIVLHNGSDGFMSLKQFATFYWPTFKKLILGVIDAAFTPCVFFNGDCTSRLEYLLELPRGKVLIHFETTDIFKAKEVLKDHMCIEGNVPSSLLQTGNAQDVVDYCKRLIDVVGEDGGLIMSTSSPVDEVVPENLKAMYDFTKEYGIYR